MDAREAGPIYDRRAARAESSTRITLARPEGEERPKSYRFARPARIVRRHVMDFPANPIRIR
jgi:hypothetical protein